MRALAAALLVSLASMMVVSPTALASAGCQFSSGFQALHYALGETVGACLGSQSHAAGGDIVQPTAHGLLVLRHSDDRVVFTDGFHTWLSGPDGIQERLNTQRFDWESGGEAASGQCSQDRGPVVDVVRDFGAVGDGVTDNTAAFAQAIATGKRVNIPPGKYVIGYVEPGNGATIILCGAGQGQTILQEQASPASNYPIFGQNGFSPGKVVKYFELQNVTVDGNAGNVCRCSGPDGQGESNGTIEMYVQQAFISHNEFRSSYYSIQLLGVYQQATISYNWFHGMALDDGQKGDGTAAIDIVKNDPADSVVYIFNNEIEECGSGSGPTCTLPSSTPGQSAVGISWMPSRPAFPPQKLVIKDNVLRNLGTNVYGTDEPLAAIDCYWKCDGSVISGNQIYNSYYNAIRVMSSNNVEVADNLIQGTGVMVNPATGYGHAYYDAIALNSRNQLSSSGYNVHDNIIQNTTGFNEAGICACFETDGSGHGVGTHVSITGNKFVNNRMPNGQPLRSIEAAGAPGVTVERDQTPEESSPEVASINGKSAIVQTLLARARSSPIRQLPLLRLVTLRSLVVLGAGFSLAVALVAVVLALRDTMARSDGS